MTRLVPSTELTADWRFALKEVVTDAGDLLQMLDLRPQDIDFSAAACADFPLKVPHSFIRRMKVGDPRDPLLLQVLAQRPELEQVPGFINDPVGELASANPQAGVIHKYQGRVLLIVTGGCAVHCRYCFRRHFPYSKNANSRSQWRQTLDYVRRDSSISEVILSGGDPLITGDEQLAELVDEIAAIPHVQRLRIHSRLPVVLPERVTEHLVNALTRPQLKTVMVMHCNHANELDEQVTAAVAALRQRNIITLNQAVLLAGINDSLQAQINLCERLFASGVLPYYLHLLDKVQGAAHFDVPEAAARNLHRQLTTRLPGYLVPKLVKEVEGADAKIDVGHNAAVSRRSLD